MTFLHSFAPGGVERVALRLCGAWAADRDLDVRLVMGREDGPLRSEAPAQVRRSVTSSRGIPTARWESLWLMIVLWREIRRQRPDMLFAAGNTYAVVAVAMKLLLGRRCRRFRPTWRAPTCRRSPAAPIACGCACKAA